MAILLIVDVIFSDHGMDWASHMAKGDMMYVKPKEGKKSRSKSGKVDEDEFQEMITVSVRFLFFFVFTGCRFTVCGYLE